MSARGNTKKSGDREAEEFEMLGDNLNRLYKNTIEHAQKEQNNFPLSLNEKERKCSRDNLLCYLALREYDLSDLQLRLAEHGLSSLGTLEGQVLTSIEHVLKHFGIPAISTSSLCKITSKDASSLLSKRSELMFGSSGNGRRTHIMVTLDSSDIHQHELIELLLENGMDIARINCAHNTRRDWQLLIEAIHHAEDRLVQRGQRSGNKCMLLMDLAGPKIRTGPMELKVRSLKISVPKDVHGRPVRFVEGFLDSEAKAMRTN